MSGSHPPDDEHPTEVSRGGADPTRPLPPTGSSRATGAWEAEVPASRPQPHTPGAGYVDDVDDRSEGPPPPGRGRQVAIGVISAILGFVLAFVVIAVTTDDPEAVDPGGAEAQQQIEDLEQSLAERESEIEQLEARLAEAEAAAGDTDADLEAQSQALDERASVLDERAAELDEREAGLDEREAALDEREAAVAEREAESADQPDPGAQDPPDEGPGDGITPPELDEEDVQNIVDRVLERLRDLFN